MIRLKELSKKGDVISCMAYIEGKEPGVSLSVDLKTGEETIGELSSEYKRIPEHIRIALTYMESLHDKDSIPETKLIMWY